MIKVLELFAGAGSFSVALSTLGIKHEIVGFSETRATAVELFSRLHNKKPEENLGDIHGVNAVGLDVDLVTFGSPCQSFSRSSNRADNHHKRGGKKGSGTKSSLMWEAVRIIGECKPKYLIWENVFDAVNSKHFDNFQEYMDELSDLGYNTYYKVLNAHELGSAQKRKRLFSISIRKDIDNGKFEFLDLAKPPKLLEEYLEPIDSPNIELLPKSVTDILVVGKDEKGLRIKTGTKLGYLHGNNGDAVDTGYLTSKTRRGRVQKKACHTLMRSKTIATIQDDKLRYLTLLEYWRLQEMPDELFKHVEDCNFSLNKAYDVVGGVINQLHLKTVFESLSKAFDWEKETS